MWIPLSEPKMGSSLNPRFEHRGSRSWSSVSGGHRNYFGATS